MKADIIRKMSFKKRTRSALFITSARGHWIHRSPTLYLDPSIVQGPAKRWSPGLVNFVPSLAYHSCLALPAAFTQPGVCLLAEPTIHHQTAIVRETQRSFLDVLVYDDKEKKCSPKTEPSSILCPRKSIQMPCHSPTQSVGRSVGQ